MRVLVYLEHEVRAFNATEAQVARLRAALPQHDFVLCQNLHAFLANLPSAEAAVVWRFASGWYALAPRLRRVMTPAAGRELIAPDPSGRVARVFGTFHGKIMAESLLAMIGFVNRRFGAALDAQRRRDWDREPYSGTRRLAAQTALLIGYGTIGRHCGALLKAVGMKVFALKRNVAAGTEGADRVFGPHELLDAVAAADHIVCILPRDTGTDNFLGRDVFARVKRTAAVYNIGRGNAIDAAALCEALAGQRLAAAFLDVVPEEPLPPDSPLWSAPNLFITPHVSALTADYLDLYFDELGARLG
ncbi:MAG TPA: NAD(P)-dependent oxidoreductase [Gammaproteobacteria bacterium]|nr:NAD(P)-dependent oxidoreductase [Gammaproteobacteria bacterium]